MKQQQYFRFTWFSKSCPSSLTIYARLVHSYLTFKAKFKKAVSARQISRALRLHPTYNVRPALTLLSDLGLLEQTKAGYLALPFPSDWVCCSESKRARVEWWRRRNDFVYCVPTKLNPLTTIQNVVFQLLNHFYRFYPKKQTSYGALVRVLGISHDTAGRAVRSLIKKGLISKANFRDALFSPIVHKDKIGKGWYVSKPVKEKSVTEWNTKYVYANAILNDLSKQGAKREEQQRACDLIVKLEDFSENPMTICDAEEIVKKSYKKAQTEFKHGSTCAALFVNILLGEVNRIEQKMGESDYE